jgi:hypothetical protein
MRTPLFFLPAMTPTNYPRQIWGLRFRWPHWGEWVALVGLILLAFTGWLNGWLGLVIAVAWGVMFLRTGLPLNFGKPLRVLVLFVLSQFIVNALLIGLALVVALAFQ